MLEYEMFLLSDRRLATSLRVIPVTLAKFD